MKFYGTYTGVHVSQNIFEHVNMLENGVSLFDKFGDHTKLLKALNRHALNDWLLQF